MRSGASSSTTSARLSGRFRGEGAIPRLEVLGAAFLFSTGGAAIKATTLTPFQVAGFRSGAAAIALALMLPAARRSISWRTVPVAFAFAATLLSFAIANKLTTSAATIFLQSTGPFYLLLLSPLLLHEKIRRHDLAFLAALAFGMVLLFAGTPPAQATAPDPALGNLLGAASGLFFALTILGLRWLARDEQPGESRGAGAALLGNVIAFALMFPLSLPVANVTPRDVAVVVYLGALQIALAYVLLTRALRLVPAFEASLLLLLEPTLNPLWAWLLLGENPGGWTLAGGAVILGATVAHSAWASARLPSST